MRAVIQRVKRATVEVNGKEVARIGPGLAILVGIARNDTVAQAHKLAQQIVNLRMFEDDEGKMNHSAVEVGAELLAVSQVTLCCDLSEGRRPSFAAAAPPEEARPIYEAFVAELRHAGLTVREGIFRAMMTVSLDNDGPVTFVVDA